MNRNSFLMNFFGKVEVDLRTDMAGKEYPHPGRYPQNDGLRMAEFSAHDC